VIRVLFRVFVLATLAICAGPVAAVAGAGRDPARASSLSAPIKRFLPIDAGLYRGGQPDDEGFVFLRDLGIRTIVSFRNDDSERELVESLGMSFVHIPITFRPFSADIPDDAVARFFAIVDDPSRGPVFFHCKRGADRTGAFAGLYRIARQGWTLERAYDEARDLGMRWWYGSVKDEIGALAPALAPAAAPQ
jgi:tyrosine-protein phosphatase SIW14